MNPASLSQQAQHKDEELSFREEDAELKLFCPGRWKLTIKGQGEFMVGLNDCSCYRKKPSVFLCDHIMYLHRKIAKHRQSMESKKA